MFLQYELKAMICKSMEKKRSLVEYALAMFGAIIAVYICFPISKDGDTYQEIFENISDHAEIEYLFRSWLELGQALEGSLTFVLLPLIFFTLLLKLKAFKYLSNNYEYAYIAYFAIFFLLHDCSQLRISAALAFALWSCVAIMHRKWIYALLLCLIAFGFHISSLLLPIVFSTCFYSKTMGKISWFFLFSSAVIYFLKIPIMEIATQQVSLLLGGRYIYYTNVMPNEQNTSGLAFVYATLLGIVLVTIYHWGKANTESLPKAYLAMLSTCVYGCGLMFLLYETVAIASRLSDVLVILIVPLLAVVISNTKYIYTSLSLMFLGVFFSARLFQLFIY